MERKREKGERERGREQLRKRIYTMGTLIKLFQYTCTKIFTVTWFDIVKKNEETPKCSSMFSKYIKLLPQLFSAFPTYSKFSWRILYLHFSVSPQQPRKYRKHKF
jgi:hypothetical protein